MSAWAASGPTRSIREAQQMDFSPFFRDCRAAVSRHAAPARRGRPPCLLPQGREAALTPAVAAARELTGTPLRQGAEYVYIDRRRPGRGPGKGFVTAAIVDRGGRTA